MKISDKTIILIVYLLLFNSLNSGAQNLFDEIHTRKYADYLFMAGQYRLSFQEYSRLTEIDSNNHIYKFRQIASLWNDQQKEKALGLAEKFYNQYPIREFEIYYYKLLILNSYHKEFLILSKNSRTLNDTDKFFLTCSSLILNNRFSEAGNLIRENQFKTYEHQQLSLINEQCMSIRLKKPFISGFLSAVIPGLGKVYSGYWQDGGLAFLYTALSAWQTYRGFRKNSLTSVYGWISAGLTAGFYFGNIYGSVKAANKYNHLKTEKFHLEIENLLNNYCSVL